MHGHVLLYLILLSSTHTHYYYNNNYIYIYIYNESVMFSFGSAPCTWYTYKRRRINRSQILIVAVTSLVKKALRH